METVKIELLAPARNAAIAIEAIKHGADAVYMGASTHGARKSAANSIEDIASVSDFAHQFYAKVYVTVNTLIYENEISDVEKLIRDLYAVGVDALIVQDLGVLRFNIPPIALHASTQCDIRNEVTARFMEGLGFSQLVLARELSLNEIKQIKDAVQVPLEAFVHGALCVSYSGCCRAGFIAAGRSGNRGECPQLCRLPYTLVDGTGQKVITDAHLLSLKDLNRIGSLEEMIDAGITSFKIEGRLKDAEYVKNVVAKYRHRLNMIIENSGGRLSRSSQGFERHTFIPDLSKSFNRGYNEYFLKRKDQKIASFRTPKMIGEKVAKITEIKGNRLEVKLKDGIRLNKGDGLGFFNLSGQFTGFRLNNIDKHTLYTYNAINEDIGPDTTLYRNLDYSWEQSLKGETSERKMRVNFILGAHPNEDVLRLTAFDDYGCEIVIEHQECLNEEAVISQVETRKRIFGKLGGTIWELGSYEDRIQSRFLPASLVANLRRKAISRLEKVREENRPIEMRRPENPQEVREALKEIGIIKNISNSKALKLLDEYKVKEKEKAIEVDGSKYKYPITVMECKYCLRREMGACLKTHDGNKLKEPLSLHRNGRKVYDIEFGCVNCLMRLKTGQK